MLTPDTIIRPNSALNYSVTFIMEQVLGHVTHYQNLRQATLATPNVQARWVEVTYRQPGGWVERIPKVPAPLKGYAIGQTQTGKGLWHGRHDDLVFFHTQKPAALYGQLPRRRPWVLSLDVTPIQYDRMGDLYNELGDSPGLKSRAKYAVNKRLFKSANLIVGWSDWVRRSLIEDYEIEERKIAVIPPGVDLNRWTLANSAPLNSAEGTPHLPRLLFCGGDWERKGGPLLLDWFKRYGREVCELHLVTRHKFTDSEKKGVGSNLFIYNNLNSNDPALIELYHRADLFVLPTRAECFGIALVEAMAMGLPVITTTIAAAAEIVQDGVNGFLIEPQDAATLQQRIETLLQDSTHRQKMGESARLRAFSHYDALKNGQLLLNRLAELL
ncbi:MAG: glycosyltransferase family 4 protein [Chloroflexota bacterium]|nr:glycosyltransferase family 4 protein [Chloroflexota bacterium]